MWAGVEGAVGAVMPEPSWLLGGMRAPICKAPDSRIRRGGRKDRSREIRARIRKRWHVEGSCPDLPPCICLASLRNWH